MTDLFSLFSDDPEEDPPSRWEETQKYVPEPPKGPSPDDLSPLPEDFPVEDPLARPSVTKIMEIMRDRAKCEQKNCVLDDRTTLAQNVATYAVQAVADLQMIAATLYAHGEELLAEAVIYQLNIMAEDLFKPFFLSAGLEVED